MFSVLVLCGARIFTLLVSKMQIEFEELPSLPSPNRSDGGPLGKRLVDTRCWCLSDEVGGKKPSWQAVKPSCGLCLQPNF